MSIIISGSELQVDEAAQGATAFGPAIRNLLDHLAAELATEYIRLMETAAEAEAETDQSCPEGSLKESR